MSSGDDAEPGIAVAIAVRVLRSRSLMRLPIRLFRWRLGWVFGGRVVLLEHRGRRSGLPRKVCLEVLARPTAHPHSWRLFRRVLAQTLDVRAAEVMANLPLVVITLQGHP